MDLYRYSGHYSTSCRGTTTYSVYPQICAVEKETPKGYWVRWYGEKKWVSKTGKKRFAYPTKEEALESFVARKQRAVSFAIRRLKDQEGLLNKALIEAGKEPIESVIAKLQVKIPLLDRLLQP